MRFKTITSLEPGDILSSDIFDQQGRIVVAGGIALTDKLIQRLSLLGFPGAYIDDELSEDVTVTQMISTPLRNEAKKCVESGNIDEAIKYAEKIIHEILDKGTMAVDMADIRAYDDYTYAHSVNVAVLCCVLGLTLNIPEKDLEYLVLAALLHDIGKAMIPSEILNKPDRLTKDEYLIVKKHPSIAYEMLSKHYDFPIPVKTAILFHHENVDGSGYPQGKTGDELPYIAKIIHVVDVYDALISDRPYKRGYSPKEAAEYLMGGCGIMFDHNIVDTFVKTIPLYPLGTEVLLSNGDKAIVIENKGIHNLRPVVRTIQGAYTVDLSQPEYNNIVLYTGSNAEGKMIEDSERARQSVVLNTESKNILIVDDMKSNITLLESILSDLYHLKSVTSGAAAIDEVRHNLDKYDLVLMDIDMPKLSGTATAATLNAITGKKLPILFVSAKCDRDTVLVCKQLDAAGYVLRPYQPVYLMAEIERVLYAPVIF